jgi:hypothetical protein
MYIQLFHFDVHEDVRTIADATIEKDEVHFLPSDCGHFFEIQVCLCVLVKLVCSHFAINYLNMLSVSQSTVSCWKSC